MSDAHHRQPIVHSNSATISESEAPPFLLIRDIEAHSIILHSLHSSSWLSGLFLSFLFLRLVFVSEHLILESALHLSVTTQGYLLSYRLIRHI